jgi:hypothetical protein
MNLSASGVSWMLARINMTTGWEPAPCVTMIDEQDLSGVGIDEDTVRDKMFGRRRWLQCAEDLRPGVDPSDHISSMVGFFRIQWLDLADDRSHGISHCAHTRTPVESSGSERSGNMPLILIQDGTVTVGSGALGRARQ